MAWLSHDLDHQIDCNPDRNDQELDSARAEPARPLPCRRACIYLSFIARPRSPFGIEEPATVNSADEQLSGNDERQRAEKN